MISLSNTTVQTIPAGQSLTFNTTLMKTGCAECHRKGTGSVKLCAKCGIYQVYFSANVTGATAGDVIQLALAIGGDVIPASTMIYTAATANAVGEVSKVLPVSNTCCDYDRITVANTGTTEAIIEANPILFIKRIA